MLLRTNGRRLGAGLALAVLAVSVAVDVSAVAPLPNDSPQMTPLRRDVKPFEYIDVGKEIPDYRRGIGQTQNMMQTPLPAEESVKHMITPVGFEPRLFVDEKDLGGKPICMNWDERGRLWVGVTVDYPNNLQPEGRGHDRIVICEDTRGTGRADKVTVFADKLSIPTSLIFYRGGVIVHQAPHTLYLKDTDGDDRADVRQILFTGWGTRDTHAGPSNLQYGLDNWIYGIVGYSGFKGTVGGQPLNFFQGFYRFKPDGSQLEFLRNMNNNSWGIGFSEEGVLFGSTANNNPSFHMTVANRYYERVRGWSSTVLSTIADDARIHPILPPEKVRQVDFHGNFTAAAGHALYTARAYPRPYWNRTAFVAEPTGKLLAVLTLRPDGASYRSRNSWNLVASDDEWTAPTMAEVGPDGNVWMIDWYAFIVQHNPTPPGFKTGKGGAYQTRLRDTAHGRIYRIAYQQARQPPLRSLKDATPDTLVATLKNDNLFWRRHAQRLLVERGRRDVVPALLQLVADPRVDDIGLNAGAIHALWTLHGLGVLDGSEPRATAAAVAALKHRSWGVRRNALQVLPHGVDSVLAILAAGLLRDEHVQVRLAAVLALADQPASPASAHALLAMVKQDDVVRDRWLYDAVTSAAANNDLYFLRDLTGLPKTSELAPEALALVERVAEHHARGVPGTNIRVLLETLASAPAPVASAILAGLARGWPANRPIPSDDALDKTLTGLVASAPPGARGNLFTLAMRLGSKALEGNVKQISNAYLAQVNNTKESDAVRLAAARELIGFRKTDAAAAAQVLEVLTPRTTPELAAGLLDAVGTSDAPGVGAAVLEHLPSLTPAARSRAVALLLNRAPWSLALLDAVDQGTVQLSELSLEQKRDLTEHPSREVAVRARRVLARGGGLPNPDRQKVVQQLMPLTQRTGDALAGKKVYQTHCAKCHMHSGEGSKIGPDLTGMAVHPKAHLLQDIIDPSFNVEDNYRVYTVSTRTGRVLSGLLASESKTGIELLDAEGKKYIVLREDIDELQRSPKSLMPEGFEKQMPETDLCDLLEFLTKRGKYLPLPLAKAATVVTTRGMFYSEEARGERMVFDDWSDKTFAGVPFHLVDPQGGRVPNAIMLHCASGKIPPRMPRQVSLPCNVPAKAVHLLSGVSGWGYPGGAAGSISMIVRLHYHDGKTEDHALKNGEHFADYIRRIDVPGSQFAFQMKGGQQLRYLAIIPARREPIDRIEFVKGTDRTAALVMAVTVETLP
jgi:putative membrane-bound dehydrogenase-like protein